MFLVSFLSEGLVLLTLRVHGIHTYNLSSKNPFFFVWINNLISFKSLKKISRTKRFCVFVDGDLFDMVHGAIQFNILEKNEYKRVLRSC